MKSLILTLALAAGLHGAAQAAPARPDLLVVISVDQLSGNLFDEYRTTFTGGLKRLQSGVMFPNAYQGHAATETCPGHATLLTGVRPGRSGIIANYWIDQSLARADKSVYCAEDPSWPGTSSKPGTIRVSDTLLKVPTLGDLMKRADPASRVVAVSGKDRAVVMMGGHAIDQGWYMGERRFETFADRTGPAPAAVAAADAAVTAEIARGTPADLPAICRPRAVAVPVGGRTVGVPAARAPGDLGKFRPSRALDDAVTGLAIGLLKEMRLGHGAAPDLLAISLSATDHVGHVYGTEGGEMCAQMMALDSDVGRILDALDASGVRYEVVLTADHGAHDMPERDRMHAMPSAERVDPALAPEVLGAAVAKDVGIAGPALLGRATNGDIYIARAVPAALRGRTLAAALARYRAHRQIAAVFTADEIARTPLPTTPPDEWTLAERFRASYDPQRSGDLLVALKPNVTALADPKTAVAVHGSPWDYDRRVPLIFYRPGTAGFSQSAPVETVDIMPTLAALIGLPVATKTIDGRCLDLDAGPADSCAR